MAPSLRHGIFSAIAACLATVSADPQLPERAQKHTGPCTKTVHLFPTFTYGPVSTTYLATITDIVHFDCGSCKHITTSYVNVGPGPVNIFTTTVVAESPTTSTLYKCEGCATATSAPK